MKYSRVAAFLVSAVSLAGFVGCAPSKDKEPPKPKVTASVNADAPTPTGPTNALPKLGAAPKWQLKDINGKLVTSEELKGKVVVVDFWATWCGPCRMEIPGYVEMVKKYGKDGFVVVGISLDEGGADVVKPFGQKYGINYPLVMGDEAVQAAFGGIEALPTTFLIDREGQVRHRKIGAEHSAEYEKKVLSVLKG